MQTKHRNHRNHKNQKSKKAFAGGKTVALQRRAAVRRNRAQSGRKGAKRHAPTVRLEGVFAATERGFGFVTVTGESRPDKDIFIPARKRSGALSGDRVSVEVKARDLKGAGGSRRIEGEIAEILSRGFSELCGTLVEAAGAARRYAPYRVIPDNLRLADEIEVADANGIQPGSKVLVRITDYGDERKPPRGEILRDLGETMSLGANYESVLLAAGIRTEFPSEVLHAA